MGKHQGRAVKDRPQGTLLAQSGRPAACFCPLSFADLHPTTDRHDSRRSMTIQPPSPAAPSRCLFAFFTCCCHHRLLARHHARLRHRLNRAAATSRPPPFLLPSCVAQDQGGMSPCLHRACSSQLDRLAPLIYPCGRWGLDTTSLPRSIAYPWNACDEQEHSTSHHWPPTGSETAQPQQCPPPSTQRHATLIGTIYTSTCAELTPKPIRGTWHLHMLHVHLVLVASRIARYLPTRLVHCNPHFPRPG